MNKKNKSANVADHLANERTFLAWIRTSLGIMAFGFMVERFALFIKQIGFFTGKVNVPLNPSFQNYYSTLFGEAVVAFGTLLSLLAFFKYKSVENQITKESYRPSPFLNGLLIVFIILMGSFLVLYLNQGVS